MYITWVNRYTDTSTQKQNSHNTVSQPHINHTSKVTCGCRHSSFILLTSHCSLQCSHYQLLQQNTLNYTSSSNLDGTCLCDRLYLVCVYKTPIKSQTNSWQAMHSKEVLHSWLQPFRCIKWECFNKKLSKKAFNYRYYIALVIWELMSMEHGWDESSLWKPITWKQTNKQTNKAPAPLCSTVLAWDQTHIYVVRGWWLSHGIALRALQ
jgi:hypothetical protein